MKKPYCFLVFLFSIHFASAQVPAQLIPLIPYPSHLALQKGQFLLSNRTSLIINDQGKFVNEVFYLQSLFKETSGRYLSPASGTNTLELRYDENITGRDEYRLEIAPAKMELRAGSPEGAFYGIQTIWQLMLASIGDSAVAKTFTHPVLSIADMPAFEWRGSMVDVSRHFFSIEYLKKHIDRLSLYKMNKLHIHLTDDQGWRIEIKKYPLLTTEGAWRQYNNQDSEVARLTANDPDYTIDQRKIIRMPGKPDIYGGFYTQEQMKDLIQYAASRHVEIIPEIDMPGHMMAAIAAYPFLTDGERAGRGNSFSVPVCPCKDSAYTFIEDVLSEIAALFPSVYIHIGADEVEKTSWKNSGSCQELMKKEGIRSVEELQSYFVHRVQAFLASKGKQIIAWDDVLEGGTNSKTSIMYWRGWVSDAPKKSVLNGNAVIMTPTNPLYFDYPNEKSALRNVYDLHVIYKDIPADKANLIKGAQANMWTERIASEQRADRMMFPRMMALAERAWTNQDLFDSFSQRVVRHYPILDRLAVNYRLPDLEGFTSESVFVGQTQFDLKSPLPGFSIRYTTDGTNPGLSAKHWNGALTISEPKKLKFALFTPSGTRGEIYTVNFRSAGYAKPWHLKAGSLLPGLSADFYNRSFSKRPPWQEARTNAIL